MRTDTVHKMPDMRAKPAGRAARPAFSKAVAAFIILTAGYYCAAWLACALIFIIEAANDAYAPLGELYFIGKPLVKAGFLFPLLCCSSLYAVLFLEVLPLIIAALLALHAASHGTIMRGLLIAGALPAPLAACFFVYQIVDRGIQDLWAVPIALAVSCLISIPACLRVLRHYGLARPARIRAAAALSWRRGIAVFFIAMLSFFIPSMPQLGSVAAIKSSAVFDICAVVISLSLGIYCGRGRALTLRAVLISTAIFPAIGMAVYLFYVLRSFEYAGYFLPVLRFRLILWGISAFIFALTAWAFGLLGAAKRRPAAAKTAGNPSQEGGRNGAQGQS